MHILLHCGRKPEYPDRTHPAEGRGLNFHTERRSESLLCQSEKRWIRTKTETKDFRGSRWLLFSWFAFRWEQQRSLGHFRCCVFVMRVFLPLSSAVDEWVPLVTVNSILHLYEPVQLLHKQAAALDTQYQVKNDLACNLIVTERWQVNNTKPWIMAPSDQAKGASQNIFIWDWRTALGGDEEEEEEEVWGMQNVITPDQKNFPREHNVIVIIINMKTALLCFLARTPQLYRCMKWMEGRNNIQPSSACYLNLRESNWWKKKPRLFVSIRINRCSYNDVFTPILCFACCKLQIRSRTVTSRLTAYCFPRNLLVFPGLGDAERTSYPRRVGLATWRSAYSHSCIYKHLLTET